MIARTDPAAPDDTLVDVAVIDAVRKLALPDTLVASGLVMTTAEGG
jgi:hypothetical protein